jgi:hypothetical protein
MPEGMAGDNAVVVDVRGMTVLETRQRTRRWGWVWLMMAIALVVSLAANVYLLDRGDRAIAKAEYLRQEVVSFRSATQRLLVTEGSPFAAADWKAAPEECVNAARSLVLHAYMDQVDDFSVDFELRCLRDARMRSLIRPQDWFRADTPAWEGVLGFGPKRLVWDGDSNIDLEGLPGLVSSPGWLGMIQTR